jgi:hypothetical protein
MGKMQGKLNWYNNCDRVKLINEAKILKEKQIARMSLKNNLAKMNTSKSS